MDLISSPSYWHPAPILLHILVDFLEKRALCRHSTIPVCRLDL